MLKEKDFNSIRSLSVNSWEQYVKLYTKLGLAINVHGIIVPNSGHFIPEEQPEFVIKQLFKFFGGNNTTNTIK
jgi:pimeloyl-ACP methyl ester carboxylesterase